MTKSVPLGVVAGRAVCKKVYYAPHSNRKLFYQVMMFILTYWMYAVYTLTRRPFSVVKIALCPSCAEEGGEDNSSNYTLYNMADQEIKGWPPFNSTNGKTLLGSIDYTFIFAYAVGLFVSGYIADRVNLRYFLVIGLTGSGVSASLLGLGYFARVHHLAYYLVFQIFSGFMQSTGWPGISGVTAKWFGKKNRGFVLGLWSSCTFVGSIIGYVLPSFFIYSENSEESPWGWSFITPAFITLATAVLAFFFLVTDPRHVGVSPANQTVEETVEKDKVPSTNVMDHEVKDHVDVQSLSTYSENAGVDIGIQSPSSTREKFTHELQVQNAKAVSVWQALLIPGVIEYSLALFFNKFVTYSFSFWLPFYVAVTYHGFGGQKSAWLSTLFDVGGIVGGLFSGVVSDRLLSSRAVLIVPMLLIGIPVLYVFRAFGNFSLVLYSIFIFLLGVFIGGPYVVISGIVSNDLGTHKSLKDNQNAKSLVTGIIDGVGTLGAATGPLVVGIVTDKVSWNVLFYILMLACFISAVFLSRLLIKDLKKLSTKCKSTRNVKLNENVEKKVVEANNRTFYEISKEEL